MNNLKKPIFFSLVGIGFLMFAFVNPFKTNPQKEAALMQTILGGLSQGHFKPVKIDDEFSEKLFDLYLNRIDIGKRWLLAPEVEQLDAFKTALDDQAYAGNFEMFDTSIELLEKGIRRSEKMVHNILAKPFDLNIGEQIEMDVEKRTFAKNEQALEDFWRKYLKYDVLEEVRSAIEKQEKAASKEEDIEKSDATEPLEDKTEEAPKSLETLEKEAREKILKRQERFFKRMKEYDRSYWLEVYLNSLTNVFDPHTSYYAPKDKENFDITMSGKLEGIGARLSREDEYTKVMEVIPGGPAWKGKELQVNDLITKVAQDEDEAIDVTGWELDEVVSKIRGKKGTKVRLTVKRADGSLEEISIIRDVVILDESFAKSVYIEKDDGKYGYIKLPRFYADFQNADGAACARDVAAEVEKLKAQNVKGIILDLRNNGGGSLREVVRMSGLFIEEGPIVQIKSRESEPEVLSDENESVAWDGPLIVMVNTFSASASEILAAALQDYERAIIVGSNSTFGKGTVQRFINLDRAIPGYSDIKPLGEIKLTIQKFYRINGESTQLRGVEPDIILPDNFSLLEEGEKSQKYAMDWTTIEPVNFQQGVYQIEKLDKIKARSQVRVSENKVFNLIGENAKRYKTSREETIYPLAYNDFDKYFDSLETESEKYDSLYEVIPGLIPYNHATDTVKWAIDESKKERNEDWLEAIQKDVYIDECISILDDMIELQ